MKSVKDKHNHSFDEQMERARKVLDIEVRPQVKFYEETKGEDASSFSNEQQAHLSCEAPI